MTHRRSWPQLGRSVATSPIVRKKKKHQEIHDALNLGLFFFLYGKLGPLADSIRGRRLAPDLRFSKKMEFLKHLDDVIVEEW